MATVQPVDLLTLIGQPDNIKVNKANVRTLLSIVYPHYITDFDQWWDESGSEAFDGYLFHDEIDEEDRTYEGEQVYEWMLAGFGAFIWDNV